MGPGMQRVISFLFLVTALFGAALPAQGQEDKKAAREREALRRVQQALRQSEEQRAALQTENAALQDKLKAASAKADQLAAAELRLDAERRRASRLDADLAKSRQAIAEMEKKLADAGARYEHLSQEHADALRTIASRDAQLKVQVAVLTQTRGEIAACEKKNLKLYGYGNELMQRYREKSAFEAIRQAEPLTGLQQAQIDNLLEEYRDKLQAQRAGP